MNPDEEDPIYPQDADESAYDPNGEDPDEGLYEDSYEDVADTDEHQPEYSPDDDDNNDGAEESADDTDERTLTEKEFDESSIEEQWIKESIAKDTIDSPVQKFFESFLEATDDPYKTLADTTRRAFEGITSKRLSSEDVSNINTFVERIHGAGRDLTQPESVDGKLRFESSVRLKHTGIRNKIVEKTGLYRPPVGFVSRTNERDWVAYHAANRSQNLAEVRFQLQERTYVNELLTRGELHATGKAGTTRILTQKYNVTEGQSTADAAGAAGLFIGNELTLSALNAAGKESGIEADGVRMEGKQSFHPKVGYYSDNNDNVTSGFISTQNITKELTKMRSQEETVFFHAYRANKPGGGKVTQILQEIQAVTEALFEGTEEQRTENKTEDSDTIRSNIESKFATKLKGRQNNVVKLNKELLLGFKSMLSEQTSKSNTKVIVSLQLLDSNLFHDYSLTKDETARLSELSGRADLSKEEIAEKKALELKGDFKTYRDEVAGHLKELASQKRLAIGVTATSFGENQGLYRLLDKNRRDDLRIELTGLLNIKQDQRTEENTRRIQEIKGDLNLKGTEEQIKAKAEKLELSAESKDLLKTFLENDVFRVLASQYMHSKSYAVLQMERGVYSGVDALGTMSSNFSMNSYGRSIEVGIQLGAEDMKEAGFTKDELDQIILHYGYGIDKGGKENLKGLLMEKKGDTRKTEEFMRTLRAMGGKETRVRDKAGTAPFRFSARYADNKLVGVDIVLKDQFSMSLTIGKDAVYINKGNRIITGATWLNQSSKDITIASDIVDGKKRIVRSGESAQISATQVAAALIATMGRTSAYERNQRSMFLTLRKLVKKSEIEKRKLFLLAGLKPEEIPELLRRLDKVVNTEDLDFFNKQQNVDMVAKAIGHDRELYEYYSTQTRVAKSEVINHLLDVYMQTHELPYSHSQLKHKQPVMGITDRVLQNLFARPINEKVNKEKAKQERIKRNPYAEGDIHDSLDTLELSSYILSDVNFSHATKLVDSEGRPYVRGVADISRFKSMDLLEVFGGIYKANTGSPTPMSLELMRALPGLDLITAKEYKQRLADLGVDSKLSKRLLDSAFAAHKERAEDEVDDDAVMLYFPYNKTDQISQRLKNLKSVRPFIVASRAFTSKVRSFGFDNILTSGKLKPEEIMGTTVAQSLTPEQYETMLEIKKEIDADTTIVNKDRELERRLKAIDLNPDSDVRGFTNTPRRVLASMGISQMSDFSFVNANIANKSSYMFTHRVQTALSYEELGISPAEFSGKVAKTLRAGTMFAAQKTELQTDNALYKHIRDVLRYNTSMTNEELRNNLKTLSKNKAFEFLKNVDAKITKNGLQISIKQGVYSTVSDTGQWELRKIGDIAAGSSFFHIEGLTKYKSSGKDSKREVYIPIKSPAVSRRANRGLSILTEDARVVVTDLQPNMVTLTYEALSVQELTSGLRSSTAKGPMSMRSKDLFDTLKEWKEREGSDKYGQYDTQIDKGEVFSLIAAGQIKGFLFEAGFGFLRMGKESKIYQEVAKPSSGLKIAEAIAITMLDNKSKDTRISNLLLDAYDTGVLSKEGKKQFVSFLKGISDKPDTKTTKFKEKDIKTLYTSKTQLDASLSIFGGLMSLTQSSRLDSDKSVEQSLIDTVAAALTGDEEAQKHLQDQALKLFNTTLDKGEYSTKIGNEYSFNESKGKSAALLAFMLSVGQELIQDIDIEERTGNRDKGLFELGFGKESTDEYIENKKYERAARAQAISMNKTLPRANEIYTEENLRKIREKRQELDRATDEAERKKLEIELKALKAGEDSAKKAKLDNLLYEMYTAGQTNRFITLPVNIDINKITPAVGMQDSTSLEGHYAQFLTQKQLNLYTYTAREKEKASTLQESLVVIGGLLEEYRGGLLTAQRVSKFYSFRRFNSVLLADTKTRNKLLKEYIPGKDKKAERRRLNQYAESLSFLAQFSESYSHFASETMPLIFKRQEGLDNVYDVESAYETFFEFSRKGESQELNTLLENMRSIGEIASGDIGRLPGDKMEQRVETMSRVYLEDMRAGLEGEKGSLLGKQVNSIVESILENITKNQKKTGQSIPDIAAQYAQFEQGALEIGQRRELFLNQLVQNKAAFNNLSNEEKRDYIQQRIIRSAQLLNEETAATASQQDIQERNVLLSIISKELLDKFKSAITIDPGTEYIEGRHKLKEYTQNRIAELEAKSNPSRKDRQEIERLKTLEKSIINTFTLELPKLRFSGHDYDEGIEAGVIKLNFTGEETQKAMVLGLDLIDRMSMVFQDFSHPAMEAQQTLITSIAAAKELKVFDALAKGLTKDEEVFFTSEQLKAYQDLMKASQVAEATTLELARNQEAIRRSMGDRLTMKGSSFIATSSFLLDSLEVGLGKRVDSILGVTADSGLKTLLIRMGDALKTSSGKEEHPLLLETFTDIFKGMASMYIQGDIDTSKVDSSRLSNLLQLSNLKKGSDLAADVIALLDLLKREHDMTKSNTANQRKGKDILQNITTAEIKAHQQSESFKADKKNKLLEMENLAFKALVLVARQGAPSGVGDTYPLGHEYTSEQEVNARAKKYGTLLQLDERSNNTMMLISALGFQFTQLGDYDGDSFQAAMTRLADTTSALGQLAMNINKERKRIPDPKTKYQNIGATAEEQDKLDAYHFYKMQSAQKAMKDYSQDFVDKVTAIQELRKKVLEQSEGAVRDYISKFMGIDRDLMEGTPGSTGSILDEELNSLVKQYRDTLDNLYSNRDIMQSFSESLSAMTTKISDKGGTAAITDTKLKALADQYIEYLGADGKKFFDVDLDQQRQQLIAYSSMLSNFEASLRTTAKMWDKAAGSSIDTESFAEIQAIVGDTGTGLLGKTYNTIIPLLSMTAGQQAIHRAAEKQDSTSAEILKTAIEQREASLDVDDEDYELKRDFLRDLKTKYTGQTKPEPNMALFQELQDRVDATFGVLTNIQQFLRDAALKPKEKTTVSLIAQDWRLSGDLAKEFSDVADRRGLHNILSGVGDDENRARILDAFIGTQAGAVMKSDLNLNLTSEEVAAFHDNKWKDIDTNEIRAFGVLEIMNEYLSGRKSAEAMMEDGKYRGLFSQQKEALAETGKLTSDSEIVSATITKLLSKFRSQFVFDNVLEGGEPKNKAALESFFGRMKEKYTDEGIEEQIKAYEAEYDDRLTKEGIVGSTAEEIESIEMRKQENVDKLREKKKKIQEIVQRKDINAETAVRELVGLNIQSQTEVLTPVLEKLREINILIGKAKEGTAPSGTGAFENIQEQMLALTNTLSRGKITGGALAGISAKLASLVSGDVNQNEFMALLALGGDMGLPGALELIQQHQEQPDKITQKEKLRQEEVKAKELQKVMTETVDQDGTKITFAEYNVLNNTETAHVEELQKGVRSASALQNELMGQQEELSDLDRATIDRAEKEKSKLKDKINRIQDKSLSLEERQNMIQDELWEDPAADVSEWINKELYTKARKVKSEERKKYVDAANREVGKEYRKGHMMSVLVLPLIFGAAQGEVNFENAINTGWDVLQGVVTSVNYKESSIRKQLFSADGSTLAEDPTLAEKRAQKLAYQFQLARVRQFQRESKNPLEGSLQALAFESVYMAAGAGTSEIASRVFKKSGSVAQTITEGVGNLFGMAVAGALTKRPIPGTEATQDYAWAATVRQLRNINEYMIQVSARALQEIVQGDGETHAYHDENGEDITALLNESDFQMPEDNTSLSAIERQLMLGESNMGAEEPIYINNNAEVTV
jgi:hypothetical protein